MDQRASGKQSGGGGEATDVIGDAAASGADARGKEFGQIERQPTKEQRGDETLREEQRQEDGLHRFGEQEQAAGDDSAAEADEEVSEAAADETGELRATEASNDSSNRPPRLGGGFVVRVFFSGNKFRPRENPFAGGPRADKRNRAEGNADENDSQQGRTEKFGEGCCWLFRFVLFFIATIASREPSGRFRNEPEDRDAEQCGRTADGEDPSPRIGRDVPVTGELREGENAEVDSGAHDSGDERTRDFGPAFGDERDAIGPDAADPKADEEAEDKHLIQAGGEVAEAAEDGIKQHAEAQRAGATDLVAERTHPDATNRRTEEQAGVQLCEPDAAELRGEFRAEKTFGD